MDRLQERMRTTGLKTDGWIKKWRVYNPKVDQKTLSEVVTD